MTDGKGEGQGRRRLSLGEMVAIAAFVVAVCGFLNTSPGTPLFELWCSIGVQLSNCPARPAATSALATATERPSETLTSTPAPTDTPELTPALTEPPMATARPTQAVTGVYITRNDSWLVVRFVGNLPDLTLVQDDLIHSIAADFDLSGSSARNVTGRCFAYQLEGATEPSPDPGCPSPRDVIRLPESERWWLDTFSVENGRRFKGFCEPAVTVCGYDL